MVNQSNNLSDAPLFIKLGFFTKKGYIIFIIFTLVYDYLYLLIFAKDVSQILIFSLPYTVIAFIYIHLAFIGSQYIFYKIKSLFGIRIASYIKEQEVLTPQLSTLFKEEGFRKFRSYALIRFNKRWITYGSLFIALLMAFFAVWLPLLLFQKDEWIENFPEIVENGLYYLYLAFRIIPYSFFMIWSLFSVISLLFLLFELMIVFNSLGNFSGLSLNNFREYFINSLSTEKPIDFSKNSEVVQFSLKRFRRKCKIIPEMFLKINLGIALGSFLIAAGTMVYISYIRQEEIIVIAVSFFFPLILGIMVLNLIIFIFPQVSIHNQLERAKSILMEKFEEIYEIKRFQYLRYAFDDNLEEKNMLLSELQTLDHMVEEIDEVKTWPFNYGQITTIILGSLFAFLPLIIDLAILRQ
ncbi:MAG: hypothetical protein ACW981_21510 [Candidatus Hodarchaeales archaeon]|jgi:hypothetical protein